MKRIFFFFEHVAMRGKAEEEKTLKLQSHLDGKSFDFFFQMFTDDNGNILPGGRNYYTVKAAILDKFGDKEEQHEVFRRAMDANLDPNRPRESIRKVDPLFAKVKLND